jgi:hypothetical protein
MSIDKNCPAALLGNPNESALQYSNSIASQQARLLKHFKHDPRLSTMQARYFYHGKQEVPYESQ